MLRRPLAAALLVALSSGVPLWASDGTVPAPGGSLAGLVTSGSSPLERVTLYAYELADLSIRQAITDRAGRFLFEALPAGLYKVIAFKAGFVPAVAMMSHAATAPQFLELELTEEAAGETRSGESYWSVREQIPPDVLRDIELAKLASHVASDQGGFGSRQFRTAVHASTGVEETSLRSEAYLSGAGVGLEGRLGGMEIGLQGQFWHLAPLGVLTSDSVAGGPAGNSASLALSMRAPTRAEVGVSTVRNRLQPLHREGREPVDYARYEVSWSQPIGERSSSQFSAQYTDQNNFYRLGWLDPAAVPLASRSWRLEGSYQMLFPDRGGLETGIRYLEREGELDLLSPTQELERRLELFGLADWNASPSVVVEYGLFTRLRDGSMSLQPRGSVLVQLGDHWQATTTASHRVRSDRPEIEVFSPIHFSTAGRCESVEEYCYRVVLSRREGEEETFAIAALDREIGETLQLYFNNDFFAHLESLYLVEGDRLPELQLSISRRISPRIIARLESNVAAGGGGILYATDQLPYENRVRYLVTSLDTRFQRSATGLFIAFHQLQQDLYPLGLGDQKASAGDAKELERLQLMLTQDLNVLLNLAAEWAIQLNMELSRGSLPFFDASEGDEDTLRRRITGGFSVKF